MILYEVSLHDQFESAYDADNSNLEICMDDLLRGGSTPQYPKKREILGDIGLRLHHKEKKVQMFTDDVCFKLHSTLFLAGYAAHFFQCFAKQLPIRPCFLHHLFEAFGNAE